MLFVHRARHKSHHVYYVKARNAQADLEDDNIVMKLHLD